MDRLDQFPKLVQSLTATYLPRLDQFVLADVSDGEVKTETHKVLGLIADTSEDTAVRAAAHKMREGVN
jgi:hypothetical protein